MKLPSAPQSMLVLPCQDVGHGESMRVGSRTGAYLYHCPLCRNQNHTEATWNENGLPVLIARDVFDVNTEALRNTCDLVSRVNALSIFFLKPSFGNLDCLRFL